MSANKTLADLELLIEDFKRSGLRELQARHGDFEIYLSQDAGAAGLDGPKVSVSRAAPAGPTAAAVSAPVEGPGAQAGATGPDLPPGAQLVLAPYLGTFYRSPKPGAPPYVEVGQSVEADSELCLVEVMKLFTALRAGVAGRVIEVLASDGELVAADQPLFVIQAS